jgi:hypothetical protein
MPGEASLVSPGGHGADLKLTMAAGLSRYSLGELWRMVGGHDHSSVHDHVETWEKTEYLCRAMAKALRAVREQLAQQWPPERSEAARAVIERITLLADGYDRLGQDSTTNAVYLRYFQWDNRELQSKLRDLMKTWEATQARAWARIRAAGLTVGVHGANEDELLRLTNQPPYKAMLDATVGPVPNDWKLELNYQAAQVAKAYEDSVSGYEGRFVASEPISPTLDARSPRTAQALPGGVAGAITWPAGTDWPTGPGSPGGGGWPGGDADTELETGGSGGGGGGPIGVPGGGPGGGAMPVPSGGATVPWVSTAAGYAMAPGGVIGGAGPAGARPATVVPMAGAPAPGGAAARSGFVAPPGGVIAGRSGTVPGAGRGPRRHPDDDQDFVVPAGSTGVLAPEPEPDEHSPGPGVIGIDR